jgi:hypothetical protein
MRRFTILAAFAAVASLALLHCVSDDNAAPPAASNDGGSLGDSGSPGGDDQTDSGKTAPSDGGVDADGGSVVPQVCIDAGTGHCFVEIAQSQSNPVTAVVHGGFLYWLEEGLVGGADGRIQRVPVGGGAVQVVALGLGGTGPNDMTVDDTSVYWADEYVGLVYSAPNTGIPNGGSPTLLAAVDGGSPYSVSVDATHIYWTDFNNGTVYSAPIGGVPDGGAPTVLASGESEPWDITNDGTNLYWTVNTATGSVMGMSLTDGGAPYAIVPLVDRPTRLQVAGGTVYFIANSANVVYSAPITGITGAPMVFATTGPDTTLDASTVTTTSFTYDGTTVYWTTSGNGDGEVRSATPGGAATTLATGMTVPFSVVSDATNIYWVNSAFGAVFEMAK